jgi:hypothetical protein
VIGGKAVGQIGKRVPERKALEKAHLKIVVERMGNEIKLLVLKLDEAQVLNFVGLISLPLAHFAYIFFSSHLPALTIDRERKIFRERK